MASRIDNTPWYGQIDRVDSITLKPYRSKIEAWAKSSVLKAKGKVLISVSFTGVNMFLNYENFKRWLTSHILEEAGEIKIEAVFNSFSFVYLLTLPVDIWTMFPEHEGWNFVSFVTSNNILLSKPAATASTSSTAPAAPAASGSSAGLVSRENVPPYRPASSGQK